MRTEEMSDREFALHSQREFFNRQMKTKLKREWDWMFIPADGVFEASWNASHPESREHFYNVIKDEEKGTWYISDAFGAAYGSYGNPLSAMLAVENSWEGVKVA